ncbi:DoxX family protein [Allopusillimonas ginsengisoli]|uniref:DoxX family protein n=1 Tax=Allopusillimonas ginsengisoli TaxID=453575 RepID=UPI0010C1AA87|nr:DoxX family protein [Allopusillimonas ginsengisoli]
MTWLDVVLVPLLIRICLVVLFPFSALDKILDWNGALKQAKSSFLPASIAPAMLLLAIVVELVTPVCIVIGWHDRLAALVLAGFCVVSALLYHNFWRYPGFWAKGDSKARSHFWDFLKNFGLVGGLMLVTFGTSLVPADQVVRHLLSSTQVYTRKAPLMPAITPPSAKDASGSDTHSSGAQPENGGVQQ